METKAFLIFTCSLVIMGLGPLIFFETMCPYAAQQESPPGKTSSTLEDRHLFSIWNGACKPLEQKIKNMLPEPGSYEHVKTRHQDDDGYVRVTALFRSKNTKGIMRLYSITADVDLAGKLSNVVGPEEYTPDD